MKQIITVLAALLLFACGDNEEAPFTWGDTVDIVVEGFCEAQVRCGAPESGVDSCVAHNVFHLCELDDTCEVALSEEEVASVLLCEEALADYGSEAVHCSLLLWGIIPEECNPIWDIQPEPEE